MTQGYYWKQIALLAGIAACAVGIARWPRPAGTILLVDRKRDRPGQADFVREFLDATQSPYSFRDGFIELPISAELSATLVRLLGGLDVALEVAAQNARGMPGERFRCAIDSSGRVRVEREAGTSGAETDPRRLLVELEAQYDTVAAALGKLEANAVGRARRLGEAAMVEIPIPLGEPSVRPIAAWEDSPDLWPTPRNEEDDPIIELTEVRDLNEVREESARSP